MIRNEHIKISNIYYMLAYAYSTLHKTGTRYLEREEFSNITNLLAAMLSTEIADLVRRGMERGYRIKEESLSSPRGKMDLSASIKAQALMKRRVVCAYDEYSENILVNQVLKTTMQLLLSAADIEERKKNNLKRLLSYFKGVDQIKPQGINWSFICDRRNNTDYRLLLNICRLVMEGMLITEKDGRSRLASYVDERRMHQLFEKFILGYFKKHYPQLRAASSFVAWNLDDENYNLLPRMQTDLMLQTDHQVLIIDTKYYDQSLQKTRFDTFSQHSQNLYQMFAYVKNKDIGANGRVSGLILYAKTDKNELPDAVYQMSGNTIYIKSLDLGEDFSGIERQLKEIAGILLG